ncbi:unnamed protein product [Linum tenue]|uniref:Uncharacterized protein n=1 Tax=Linum tenue TaxID=586396 RepID=A0AAV0JIC8_9ROSI|nr:unnamed protein product [Linum tenue]
MEQKKPPRPQRHSFSNPAAVTTTKQRPVWDCDSALYDSFELRSFEKQLSSAINSRTLSMPHLPDRRVAPDPASSATSDPVSEAKKRAHTTPFKISKSVQRFFKSVFVRPSSSGHNRSGDKERRSSGVYFMYDKTGALCTIPEGPESGGDSFGVAAASPPDVSSRVGRSASERFTAATAVGISCA